MYESYWHLTQPAFDNDANGEFYFPSRSHHGALLKLRYLVENRKELGLLVGDHGLGKTYLTHLLESQLGASNSPVVRLMFPTLAPGEMLRYLAGQLGVSTEDRHGPAVPDVILTRLQAHIDHLHESGRRPVMIIDDAHFLELPHLQTLQLLLNLHQRGLGASLLLVGRSELLPRLRRLPGLSDRVAVRTTLQPLTLEECSQYIEHRLHAAGMDSSPLEAPAVESLWRLSQGVPRRLNQLCDLSLLVGYADGLSSLTKSEVEAAAEELCCVSAD